MLQKLTSFFSETYSWWFQTAATTTTTSSLPLLLTVTLLLILSLSWFLYLKPTTLNPPLPPGPLGLLILGSLPFLDPELHTHFSTLSQTHGPILTLRSGTKIGIVISSPSISRQILKDHDVTFANHDVPVAGREAAYGSADIVWTSYGPEWRMLRKVCVREMLSNATLDSVYGLRRCELRRTIQYFYSRVGSG
ncbi:hypothetical protein CsSME_00044786 [Camellia sinensis var. sinensis]